ncbi:MAG: hypothetical protein RLZZ511_146 [Cyanobacteriota bacterium]|jgi:hypothetical protein
MSADVFHSSYHCPLCRNLGNRPGDRHDVAVPQGQMRLNPSLQPAAIGWFQGQLRCPYCQSNFVSSGRGQFVRDPFHVAPRLSIQQLRRQSRPLARLRRDLQPLLLVVAGALTLVLVGGLTHAGTRDRFFPSQPTANPMDSTRPSIGD